MREHKGGEQSHEHSKQWAQQREPEANAVADDVGLVCGNHLLSP
jgi:hypothetical protein